METKLLLIVFKPLEIQILVSRPRFIEGQPFEFELGSRIVNGLGSFRESFKNLITQTNTPRFVEEVVEEVMQVDKKNELFQTMAIVNLHMGNMNMEVSTLKNTLAIEKKEKATLQEELDKEKDFHKEYKHNIKIWKKQRIENEQKIKTFILKMKDNNEKFKEKIVLMKS